MNERLIVLAISLSVFALPAADLRAASLESSREFSGKPFLEMQNKAREVKLDFVLRPSETAPLKLSAPAKRGALASQVKELPSNAAEMEQFVKDNQRTNFELLNTAMTLTITGIGVVGGALVGGVPGAIVGGGIAYGIWTAAKKTS